MEHDKRQAHHKRNQGLEQVLAEVNDIAESGARSKTESWSAKPTYPPLFIVGCARSGSTLLMQWLAASQKFAYPSNLASRLFGSPKMGALLHRAFIDLDTREEITPADQRVVHFDSSLGKTIGAAQPNEFWYFWRRFFKFDDLQKLTDNELNEIGSDRFVHELAEFESVFGKPIAMKAMIVNWHLDFIHQILPNAIFVFVQRDTASNALSLLNARREFFGDEQTWYSFKPPEYDSLSKLSPMEQVVAQVLLTENAVARCFEKIPSENTLTVSYESFCDEPEQVWRQLQTIYKSADPKVDIGPYSGPTSFDKRATNSSELEEIGAIVERLSEQYSIKPHN